MNLTVLANNDLIMIEDTAKQMDKVAKKYADKVEKEVNYKQKNRPRPYPFMAPISMPGMQPPFMPQQQQQFPAVANMPSLQPPFIPQQQFPAMVNMPTMQPMFQPGRNKYIDKSNSTCRVCKGLGHWGGDPACPYTIQAPATSYKAPLASRQPPPPGTN